MTITYNADLKNVDQKMSLLYAQPRELRQMVAAIMITAMDNQIDMITDNSDHYACKRDIDNLFARLPETSLDMFNEMIDDFALVLKRAIELMKVKATVMAIRYTPEGDLFDLDVKLDFPEFQTDDLGRVFELAVTEAVAA